MVTGNCAEEEVGAGQQGLVEHDSTDAGHGPDQHAEDQPLLQIGRTTQPTG